MGSGVRIGVREGCIQSVWFGSVVRVRVRVVRAAGRGGAYLAEREPHSELECPGCEAGFETPPQQC